MSLALSLNNNVSGSHHLARQELCDRVSGHRELKSPKYLQGTLQNTLAQALHAPITDVERICSGNSEAVFKFQSAGQKLVATVFALPSQNLYGTPPAVAEQCARTASQTHQYLANRHPLIVAPEVIHFDGNPFIRLPASPTTSGNVATVAKFLPGKSFLHLPQVTEDDCRQAGQALAFFHWANPYPAGVPNLNSAEVKFSSVERMLDLQTPIVRPLSHGDYAELARARQLAGYLWLKHQNSFANGSVHNDFTPSNALRLPNGKFAITDFGEVSDGPREFDVAIALLNWAVDKNKNPSKPKYDAFLDGYRAEQPLSSRTLSAMPELTAVAAFRWATIRAELITQLGVSVPPPTGVMGTMKAWLGMRASGPR